MDSLAFRLGLLLWLERNKQEKKLLVVAHGAKITVDRLKQIEKGNNAGNINIYERLAKIYQIPLWKLVKQCKDFKPDCKLYKLAEIRRRLKKERGLT